MAINFPNSPILNQSYSSAGRSWQYDGEKWVLIYSSVNIDGGDASIPMIYEAEVTNVVTEIYDGGLLV
jgi:hypothetical protein